MTTLIIDRYDTIAREQSVPQWMREERYGYCEPSHIGCRTSLLHKLISLFN